MNNNNTEVTNFPVKDLPSRYSLGRAAVYNRLEKLNIKPYSISNKAFVTTEELARLDALDAFLKEGKTMNEFLESQGLMSTDTSIDNRVDSPVDIEKSPENKDIIPTLDNRHYSLDTSTDTFSLAEVKELVYDLIKNIQADKKSSIDDLRNLQEIADNNWQLPTKRMAEIVGCSPATLSKHSEYHYCGFVIIKTTKQGRGFLWRVGHEDKF
ncbi:MAG: hypothetical protein EA365_10505 [Gloeocapsa sp. DLM2.Bin57]|nr:MAG: hypothetical protein EA365_10505 [Gloeocapsa sp. DLM2.Bin57]